MKITTTYAAIKDRYPTQVAEVMSALRKGKSKEKNSNPEDLNWYFNCCIQIISGIMNGAQFLNMLASGTPPPRLTPEQKYQEHKSNTHVCLHASKGKGDWGSRTEITPIPQEVDQWLINGRDIEIREETRVNSLTPEQKNQEVQDCLKTLSKSRGFRMFSFPQK